MTLREFVAYYEGQQLEAWDHTTAVSVEVHNHKVATVSAAGGKEKVKQFTEQHPLRSTESTGIPINKSNFGVLKDIAKAITAK